MFHKKVISRIFHFFSSKKIRRVIFFLIKKLGLNIQGNYKIIDISCGYDDLLIRLAQRFEFSKIIGNDVGWQQLLSFPKKQQLPNIVLTKRNILSQEFCHNEEYDLIICKNTLHHLPRCGQEYLISKLLNSGKRILIVEIANPLKSLLRSYTWNFYYRKFLKDNGNNFLDYSRFKSFLQIFNEPHIKISIGSIKTIKGNYLIACIEQKNDMIIKNIGVI